VTVRLGARAFSGALWLGAASYGRTVFAVAVQIALARLLAPEAFGAFAMIIGGAELLFAASALCSPQAVIRYQYENGVYPSARVLARRIAAILLCVGLSGTYVAYLVGWLVPELAAAASVVVLAKALRIPATIDEVWLEKDVQYRVVSVAVVLVAVGGGVAGLAGGILGIGVWALVAKEFTEALVYAAVIGYARVPGYDARPNRELARVIGRYGVEVIAARVAGILYTRGPAMLLGWGAGSGVAGLFDRAHYLANVQNRLLEPVTHRIGRAVYGRVQKEPGKIREAVYWHLFIGLRWSIPVAVVLFVYDTELITFILGTQWREAAVYLGAMAPWIALRPAATAMQVCCQSIGYPRAVTWSHVLGLAGVVLGFGAGWLTGTWTGVPWGLSAAGVFQLGLLQHVLSCAGVRVSLPRILLKPLVGAGIFGAAISGMIQLQWTWPVVVPLSAAAWLLLMYLLDLDDITVLRRRIGK
jgi:O-antigen/teichoic acid export membrane protein